MQAPLIRCATYWSFMFTVLWVSPRELVRSVGFAMTSLGFKLGVSKLARLGCPFVTEPDRRGLHRRTPCSHVHLAYSLCQLREGMSPPYALDPYDRSRNVLQTPKIYTLYSHCPRSVTLRYAFFLHQRLAYNQFYIFIIPQTLPKAACL